MRLSKSYWFTLEVTLVMPQPVLIRLNQGSAIAIVVTIYRPSLITVQPGSISSERNEITRWSMVLVNSLCMGSAAFDRDLGTEPFAVASGFPLRLSRTS